MNSRIKYPLGHKNGITCLMFSSDGKYIVSGSDEKHNNLILWNGKTGQQIKVLEGHQDYVKCVAFSPDGKYIVSGAQDHNLILWDTYSGEQAILCGHQSAVTSVKFSPDGECIVSGSQGNPNNLILWNKTGQQISALEGHLIITDLERQGQRTSIRCVSFSPDGNYIASGSWGWKNNLILWNGKTGEQITMLKGHKSPINSIAFSPDGNYIVSGSDNHAYYNDKNNFILWNGKTGKRIKTLESARGAIVNCVSFSPDENCILAGLFSSSDPGKLILWSVKTGEQIKTLEGHEGAVTCIAFSPDGEYIVSGTHGDQNNLILWNKNGEQVKILHGHRAGISCVMFSPDGHHIVSGSYDSTLIMWDGKTGALVKILNSFHPTITQLD